MRLRGTDFLAVLSALVGLAIWANDTDGFAPADLADWWNSLWSGSLQWAYPYTHWHHEPFVVFFLVLAAALATAPRIWPR